MHLKANLHFHSSEDPCDPIRYSLYEGIDRALSLGFDVLASTAHTRNIVTADHLAYAHARNILLIPGIEANVYETGSTKYSHVVILNCDERVHAVRTFDDLARYREERPDCFVLAAHPYFYGTFSLGSLLERYVHLFDAIELSWFYTRWFNRNVYGARVAQAFDKPFVATSDTHFFDFMHTNYVTADATERTIPAFFAALHAHRYKNTTSPRSLSNIFGTFAVRTLALRFRKMLAAREDQTPF